MESAETKRPLLQKSSAPSSGPEEDTGVTWMVNVVPIATSVGPDKFTPTTGLHGSTVGVGEGEGVTVTEGLGVGVGLGSTTTAGVGPVPKNCPQKAPGSTSAARTKEKRWIGRRVGRIYLTSWEGTGTGQAALSAEAKASDSTFANARVISIPGSCIPIVRNDPAQPVVIAKLSTTTVLFIYITSLGLSTGTALSCLRYSSMSKGGMCLA